jgi:hypothetical protein
MLSFRSILFAAAAFATVVSAIPTPETAGGLTNVLPVGSVGNVLPAAPQLGGLSSKRGDEGKEGKSCGDLFKKCKEDIAVIVIKIG